MGLSRNTQQRIARIAKRFGGLVVSLIGKSLRLEIRGWNRILFLLRSGKPIVFQFWHGDMFIAWYLTAPLHPAGIVSQAGDGDIASAVLEGINFVTFRGSSTRGGRKAYSSMIRYLRKQNVKVSAFASDGPKGPRYVMKAGTYVAAQNLDGYIIPVASSSKWAVRANSWDKFSIPMPFSRATISFGKTIKVDKTLRGEVLYAAIADVSEICKTHQKTISSLYR